MSDPLRRRFLSMVAGAAALVTSHAGYPKNQASKPRRFGMVIDLDRCVHCGACGIACSMENNVFPMGETSHPHARPIHWMDFLSSSTEASPLGEKPAPIPCMHCEEAPCVQICPVGATYRTPEGLVAQIWDRCIGCRACMVACPYSRRYYNFTNPTRPPGIATSPNPEVALRPAGVVEKCTFCHHRLRSTLLRRRLANELPRDEDFRQLPACAQACPAEAITFGDLNDPDSQVTQLARSPRSLRLLEHLGTKPKVIYLRGRA